MTPSEAPSTLNLVDEGRERRHPWRRLLRRVRLADRRFAPLYAGHAALCVQGLKALAALLRDVSDPDGRVREIESLEKQADRVVDAVRALLRRAWWPPFAPALLLGLINALDDVLDVTEDAAESLHLYHVTSITPEARRLADLAVDAAMLLQTAVARLATLEDPRSILAICEQVDDLEAQADHVQRSAMSRLFRDEPDSRQLIKLKAIYEVLESLTDRCKDVAGAIEMIVLRYR